MNDKYGAETDLRLLGPRTGNTKSLVSLMKEYLNQYPASYCGDVGIPSPAAVRLGVTAFVVTGGTAIFLTATNLFFSLLCGSTGRSAVLCKGRLSGLIRFFGEVV